MSHNRLQSYNNIFIIGMPGSGKSVFARTYAYYSQKSFIDFDDFFEKSLNMKIADVFASKGLEGFRVLESKALKLLSKRNHCVIGLGGGTLLAPENYLLASQNGLIVSLTNLPYEILAKRIWQDKQNPKKRPRPLFNNCQNIMQVKNKLVELFQEREMSYEKADLILNQEFNSMDTLVLALKQFEQNFDKKEYCLEM